MKLNLASGQRPFKKPWLNIDVKDQGYAVDILTDAKDLHMIESDSVDIIVAHHLVEHLAIHELNTYITEWRRVLKTGGVLAVFVPNIKELDKAWINDRIDAYIHNVNTYGAFQDSIHDLHKWGYDKQELIDRMSGWNGREREIQWSQIRDYNPNNPIYEGADIAQDWWILSQEFVK